MRRTKADADETRRRIIDAAEELFFQKGVTETTLEQIARYARVTRGAVYWHFADKHELFEAVVSAMEMPQDYLASVECPPGCSDPLAIVHESALHMLKIFVTDERQQRVYAILARIGMLDDAIERARNRIVEAYEQQSQQLVAIFQAVCDEGLMNPDWTPASAERALGWTQLGLIQDWLMSGRKYDLQAEGEDVIGRLMRCFRKA